MMINVTQTFLPPLIEYNKVLSRAWEKKWLTNRGQLVLELETKLKNKLKVSNIVLTTNGTLPIQLAIKALNLKGEIITTPFSYIATTSSIIWENCKPIFVDIHPEYLTINENLIENKITKETSAILATHVFGNPCNIEIIEEIAAKYNLKVIYDAAHCYGIDYKGKSIFEYGDVSTCSFHATKVFHTGEGGAFFAKNNSILEKMFYHHNFGHKNSKDFYGLGINAKMSELQAAMGLSVLPYMDEIFEKRKLLVKKYLECLDLNKIKTLKLRDGTLWNYSYFPVIFSNQDVLLKVLIKLKNKNIFPRRYFYPSLNTIKYLEVNDSMEISESISERILCLPLYFELELKQVIEISKIINKNI